MVCTFGFRDAPEGEYEITIYPRLDSYPEGQFIEGSEPDYKKTISAEVKKYNEKYQQDRDGKINYGFALLNDHIYNRYTEKSVLLSEKHKDYNNIHEIGDTHDWPFGIKYADDSPFYSSKYGKGYRELHGNFIYNSPKNDDLKKKDWKIKIDYSFDAHLHTFAVRDTKYHALIQNYMHLYAGVFDQDNYHYIAKDQEYYHKTEAPDDLDTTEGYGRHKSPINDTISFIPERNTHYFLYLKLRQERGYQYPSAYDSSRTKGTIEKINYIHLRFVEQ